VAAPATTIAYWPWWLGAVVLAAVTVGTCLVARRPLGVSGILARFVNLPAELSAARRRRVMAANEAALEALLLAATAEAFGPAASPTDPAPPARLAPLPLAKGRRGCGPGCGSPERPPLGAHAAFLAAMVAGGALAQLARGAWLPRLDMGPTFAALHGDGLRAAGVLALGGALVGLGATLSGGCSTGHGLSGCSRLHPASLVATAVFLGAGVAVSFLLRGLA
jgi:uncharacterized membrane protein YedE/YeeE